MRRSAARIAITLLAAVVLAGACGGDDDGDESSTEAGSTSETTAPTDTTVAGDTSTTVAAAGGATATTAKGGSTATTRAGGTAGGQPSATSPPPPAQSGVKFAAPGKYTYDAAGTSPLGPPGPATLTVDPPNGADQRAVLSSNQGSNEQILRYQTDGAYLVLLKTSQPAEEFRPNPPVLAAPQPAPVGKTWSWTMTSADGDTTVKSEFKVTGNETVTIGGEQVPTFVVEATITINSPSIAAVDKRTMWVSDNYRLIVKQRDIVDTTKPFASHSDVTATLRSTKPA